MIISEYDGSNWQFIEVPKASDYKFDLSNGSETEPRYIVILKEYLGKTSEESGNIRYTGKLLNDELYTFGSNTFCIVLVAPTSGIMTNTVYMEGAEIPENAPKELIFEYIPYEKIIKESTMQWRFKPKGIGEITVPSYWIYTNETWFNADEIKKFEFQEKTASPSTDTQEITPDDGYDGLSKVTVNAIHLQTKTLSPTADGLAITPDAGFDGLRRVNINPIKLQDANVSPRTYIQHIDYDKNKYSGLGSVIVRAVTSSIDSNIVDKNIKKGVAILGVNGTYEGYGSTTYSINTLSTTLPQTLFDMGIAQVGSEVYLFGGYASSSGSNKRVNTIYKFNIETETMTTLSATLPKALSSMGVAHAGSNIYIFGGSGENGSPLNTIYKFNTDNETISTLTITLPKALSSMGVATVGSNVYILGGSDGSGSPLNTIYKFNVDTETITTLSTTLSHTLSNMGVATVGSKVYLFGGSEGDDYPSSYIYKFNVDTETISSVTTALLPNILKDMGVAQIGSNVYLFGGSSYSNSSYSRSENTIYKFNSNTETTSILSEVLPKSLSDIGVSTCDSNVYLFGGSNLGDGIQNTIYKFSVDF